MLHNGAPLGALLIALLGAPGPIARPAEQGPLGLADLPAYQAALTGRAAQNETPIPATFRDLWDNPGRFEGRRVQVAGTIARRFHQGPYGVFPALDETWVVQGRGNPLCLVSPAQKVPTGKPGDMVQFTGTYLRRIEYQGGDVPRLAPLIVGDQPPSLVKAAPRPRLSRGLSALDWTVGLAITGLVAMVLARQHLRRPPRRLLDLEPLAPPPEFVQPGFEDQAPAV